MLWLEAGRTEPLPGRELYLHCPFPDRNSKNPLTHFSSFGIQKLRWNLESSSACDARSHGPRGKSVRSAADGAERHIGTQWRGERPLASPLSFWSLLTGHFTPRRASMGLCRNSADSRNVGGGRDALGGISTRGSAVFGGSGICGAGALVSVEEDSEDGRLR